MAGDTDSSLLPVHVDQLALQAAAGGAEHLGDTEISNGGLASRRSEKVRIITLTEESCGVYL